MALSKSALSDLLDALRAGGDLDVIREGLALVLQALIEAEAAQHIGADRYERSASRTTHRNGSRSRLLSTKAGDVELRIPKLREGSFFPALLEPRRRIDRALLAVVIGTIVWSLPLTMVGAKMLTSATAPQMPSTATGRPHRAIRSRAGKAAPNKTKPVATAPQIQIVSATIGT
jgi:hypothetical protein